MNQPVTYKGYCAKIEYSDELGCLIGRIADIRRHITFQGDSVEKIKQAFEEAVDVYLAGCAERNEEPEKPCAAPSVVRVSPAFHSIIAMVAKQEKKGVGEWLASVRKKSDDKAD
ncbi:MAG: type II toxin-antitoxin system HicB family antitoxin [Smithellaceae bacterium]